jgi:hypothetical protein
MRHKSQRKVLRLQRKVLRLQRKVLRSQRKMHEIAAQDA